MTQEPPVIGEEVTIRTEVVRLSTTRSNVGDLRELASSLLNEGQRHPITLWSDCTTISGARRLQAALMGGADTIRAVFVDNVEDAAARLTVDLADDLCAKPMTWSEVCRLWQLLIRLDEPAAIRRADAARRRGVQLRKQTQAGKRPAGRASSRGETYLLDTIAAPWGIREASASRVLTIFKAAHSTDAPLEYRQKAVKALANLDNEIGSIWSNFAELTGQKKPVNKAKPKTAQDGPPEAAPKQLASWARTLPVLEGLVSGLMALGPPSPVLGWDEIAPVAAQLTNARRDLDVIIRKMKERNPA